MRAEARPLHRAERMGTQTTAWLVVSVAGISCGVIAGLQHDVTASAVVAISAVVAAAAVIVARLLPRHAESP